MKRMLFIAPIFHGYETLIIDELKRLDFEVDFFPELINNWKYKLCNLLSRKKLLNHQRNYFKIIEKKISDKNYDILFVIRGFRMPTFFLEFFRRNNPDAKMVMYQWDANQEEEFDYLIPYFDRVYSFDPYDCQKLDLTYNPLFYTNDIIEGKENRLYDLFIVGAYMPHRYEIIKKIIMKYQDKYNIFAYLHIPPSTLLREKLRGKKIDLTVCHTTQLSRDKYIEILSSSKAILDASKPTQTGLAIRIIEALASKVKVITTNPHINKDNNYNPNNIMVIQKEDPIIIDEFISTAFNGEARVNSIKKWLEFMIRDEQKK